MNTLFLILVLILLVLLLAEVFKSKAISFFKSFHVLFGAYFFLVLGILVLSRLYSNQPFSSFFQYLAIPFLHESSTGVEYAVGHRLISMLIPLFFVFILLVSFIILPRNTDPAKFSLDRQETRSLSTADVWFGSLVVILVFLLKENICPYYFTQDDTHSQFLPKILVGIKMLLNGEFPFIDNYQHFGAPLFEIGTYAILDPIMIFSYMVARYIVDNPYATIEVYAFISAFLGAIFFGYSLKILKVDHLIGITSVICFFIMPYFFIAGRSWYYVFGIACYLPVLLYFFLLSLCGRQSIIWFLCLGVCRSLFFYAGNSQFFVYGSLIEFVSYLFLVFKYKNGKHIFRKYFYSLLFTAGLILPLLLSQMTSAIKVERPVEDIISKYVVPLDALVTFFIPAPFFQGTPTWGNKNWWLMPNLWYVGFTWIICFYAGLLMYIKTGRGLYKQLLILATFILLLSFGPASLIYPLKHFVPVINKMQKAFKLFPFAVFLIFLYGALLLSEVRKVRKYTNIISFILVSNLFLNILVSLILTNTAFYTFSELPYPKLAEPLVKYLSKDDVISTFTSNRSEEKPYVTLLPHNYSCLYDLMVVNIYDPLLPTVFKYPSPKTSLKDYFASLGVSKIILQKASILSNWRFFAGQFDEFQVLYQDEDFILYETKNPKWLLWPYSFFVPVGSKYSLQPVHKILSYTRASLKAKIISNVDSGWLFHNEFRKGYYIKINGRKYPIKESKHGWCYFKVPKGENIIEIGYTPPLFLASLLMGTFLIISSCVLFMFL